MSSGKNYTSKEIKILRGIKALPLKERTVAVKQFCSASGRPETGVKARMSKLRKYKGNKSDTKSFSNPPVINSIQTANNEARIPFESFELDLNNKVLIIRWG